MAEKVQQVEDLTEQLKNMEHTLGPDLKKNELDYIG